MKSTTKRREATPEQKAAAAERRERIKGLWKAVAAMPTEARVAFANEKGIRNPEGHALSASNSCLLAEQLATVSIVGGFKQWRAQGRMVRKGEKALAIWVPIAGKVESEPADGEDGDRFFILGNVFDISQTDVLSDGEEEAVA